MIYNAVNGTVDIGGATMDYISFGKGKRNLILLPGLGDGLKTVKGMALPMALMYRIFADDFKVYVFSTRNDMPDGYTTENMAEDLKKAADKLFIEKACLIGVSMGGMTAQHFAAEYPENTEKLVLAVTCPQANDCVKTVVSRWMKMISEVSFAEFMTDNVKEMYTEKYFRKYRYAVPLVSLITKPKSYNRFMTMANACITHNSIDKLDRIAAPTLVIGGEKDTVVGAESSYILAENIKNSKIIMYREYGHALYEEAKDFNATVKKFLL